MQSTVQDTEPTASLHFANISLQARGLVYTFTAESTETMYTVSGLLKVFTVHGTRAVGLALIAR